jgi:hypothetical protein
MLKSSSLYLSSSNLGTFWLKIEQFWPFEEKKSSPLKLLSQSQPNFAEIILGWSPFKIVSVSTVLYPRWPPLLKIEISSNGSKAKFGCGGHLDRRAEPSNTFWEENHPMTISSKFCSY